MQDFPHPQHVGVRRAKPFFEKLPSNLPPRSLPIILKTPSKAPDSPDSRPSTIKSGRNVHSQQVGDFYDYRARVSDPFCVLAI